VAYKNSEQQKEYAREHYQRNKSLYKSRSRSSTPQLRERNKKFVDTYKLERGCSRCGFKDYAVCLDFHHCIGEKENNISIMVNRAFSLENIQTEIDKCIILCANCHRLEHAAVSQLAEE
jgi:hypothetical protein